MPDIVTGKTFVDGEKGITATKLNQIQSLAVIQPAFYSAKPSTATLDPTDVLLDLKGTGSYAQITGSNLISSVAASVSSTRPRSFNAIGNPTFEVDQRNVGAAVSMTPTVVGWVDRWVGALAGTMRAKSQQIAANVVLPGTNFLVTQNVLRITITTLKASLAAGDYLLVTQSVEGPLLRELLNDVHSVSLLARSSIANLQFGLTLQDSNTTHSLSKLCSLGAANTWALIQLPNLPIWTAGGSFPIIPGGLGYYLNICLAAGTTYMPPANDAWQNGSFFGAVGQSNFAVGPVNATFDLAFVQHEPGAQCTTLIDKPFSQNYDEDLRYYSKTYSYGVKAGVVDFTGSNGSFIITSATGANGFGKFAKTMAKVPSVSLYNPNTGTINTAYEGFTGAAVTGTTAGFIGDSGFNSIGGASGLTTGHILLAQYIADTGW